MHKHIYILLIAIFFQVEASAQSQSVPISHSATEHTEVDRRTLNKTYTNQKPWEDWSLTERDWQRYQMLLKSPRGQWSPKLDPIRMLGIEAPSLEEQQRFARLYIEMYDNRVRKEQRFQLLLNDMRRQYYADIPVASAEENPKADTYALFISAHGCDEACQHWLNRGMALVNVDGSVLHIYLDGIATDSDARQWALANSIPPRQLYDRQVVLHQGRDAYKKYASQVSDAEFPMLVAITNTTPKKVIH